MLRKFSPCWLRALLSLPALQIAHELSIATSDRVMHGLLHPSGEWAARFLLPAMLASPLAPVLHGWRE